MDKISTHFSLLVWTDEYNRIEADRVRQPTPAPSPEWISPFPGVGRETRERERERSGRKKFLRLQEPVFLPINKQVGGGPSTAGDSAHVV